MMERGQLGVSHVAWGKNGSCMQESCHACSGMEQTVTVGEARCVGQIACRGVVVAWGKREFVEVLTEQVTGMVMKACMVGEGTNWMARGKGKKQQELELPGAFMEGGHHAKDVGSREKKRSNLHDMVMHAK